MGAHVVKVPDIGEGVAEVELVAWRVKVGDVIAEDQALGDVMTDKATVEIPSPVAGKVLALGGEVGQVLAVGSELIRIEVAGGGRAEAPATAVEQTPSPAHGEPVETVPAAVPQPTARGSPEARPPLAPEPFAQPLSHGTDRPIASPAVRRRAWELGIDLADVTPTGTAGRIMQADVDAHTARFPAPRAGGSSAALSYQRAIGERTEAVTGLRRRIAQKMQEAKRRIPHFSYVEEVDVTEVEALRASLNAQGAGESARDKPRITLLPFLIRAMVLAVRDFPQLNARFDDEAGKITRYEPVHIGIATQTDAGLMVPVLRHAEALDLWRSAVELARLADKARAGKATRDELSGSTITVTSLGALGGIASTPVINHPEVAIVGVNRIVERPVLVGGAVVARRMMNLSSSFDHRVIDGLHAAQFVQRIKVLLEQPALLFLP